jgi:AMP nucleosidase
MAPGSYSVFITQPRIFERYLVEQLTHLQRDRLLDVEIDMSQTEIPFPYVIDGLDLGEVRSEELVKILPTTELSLIGDRVVDGAWRRDCDMRPPAHFERHFAGNAGPRTGFDAPAIRRP